VRDGHLTVALEARPPEIVLQSDGGERHGAEAVGGGRRCVGYGRPLRRRRAGGDAEQRQAAREGDFHGFQVAWFMRTS
jgi:hypothetical protein